MGRTKRLMIGIAVAAAAALVGIAAWGLWNADRLKESLLRTAVHFGPDVEQEYREQVTRSMAKLRRIRPQLMEDVALAERSGLYPTPPVTRLRERDAGTLLNGALHWDGLRSLGYETEDRPPENDLLVIETELNVRELSRKPSLSSGEREQLRQLAATLDFAWLEKLHDYEYWSLDRHSPVDRMERHLEDVDVNWGPMPRWGVLLEQVSLAMIAAVSGDIPPPHRAFRQLARLLNTTESLLPMMLALEVLREERRMYDQLAVRNDEVDAGWQPFSFEEIDRLHAALRTTTEMMQFAGEDDVMQVFREARPFQCVALNDYPLTGLVQFRPILKQAVPETYRGFDTALEVAGHCQLRLLRAVWNNDAYLRARMEKVDIFETVSFPSGEHQKNDSPVSVFDLADSPTTSRHAAFTVLSVTASYPFSSYD